MTAPLEAKPPSEDFEAKRLVSYMESRGLRFSHLPLETSSKRQAVKNRSIGTRKGVPDFVCIVAGRVVWIELKRRRLGRVSPEQRAWVEALCAAGTPAKVCLGFDEAKAFLESFDA